MLFWALGVLGVFVVHAVFALVVNTTQQRVTSYEVFNFAPAAKTVETAFRVPCRCVETKHEAAKKHLWRVASAAASSGFS